MTTQVAQDVDVDAVVVTAPDDDAQRGDADPPPRTPGGVDLPFRPDVEGLRAVAVVLVVLYHAGVTLFSGGFVGVDVFFVISGYLITGLLLREHERRKTVSIPGFYARRARRILPAAMAVIVVTLLISHHLQNPIAYTQYNGEAKNATWFWANFKFVNEHTNYFEVGNLAPSPLLHFWSLAVEEQFYLVWPALVIFVGCLVVPRFVQRPGVGEEWGVIRLQPLPLRWTVLVTALGASVASFFYCVHLTSVNAVLAYYSPFARGWELGVGAAIAAVARYSERIDRRVGIGLAWSGIGVIAYSATAFSGHTVYPGVNALLPVLGAAAIIVGGASGRGAGHLLGLPPVRAVGRVSYGWYLLHYPPMILLTGSYFTRALPVHERLLIAVVTLAIAFAMYYVLERPIRRSAVLARHPWLSIAMGAALLLGTFLFLVQYQSLY